jgi:hypothetical protein
VEPLEAMFFACICWLYLLSISDLEQNNTWVGFKGAVGRVVYTGGRSDSLLQSEDDGEVDDVERQEGDALLLGQVVAEKQHAEHGRDDDEH